MSQLFPAPQAGQGVTPEPKHVQSALALRGHLFDTSCVNPRHPNRDCLHGALPREAASRAQIVNLLVTYFAERMQDEEANAPMAFTNMQFYSRNERFINQDMINLLYADAVNAILNRGDERGYGSSRMLFRLAMYFGEWKKHGSVDSWASEEQKKNIQIPSWIMEQQRILNMVETDLEVAKHLSKKVPCNCLDDIVADLEKKTHKGRNAMAECYCCHKKSKEKKILRCSRCKQVQYCGTECQAKDWPFHKPLCRIYQGKTANRQDLEKTIADFRAKHQK